MSQSDFHSMLFKVLLWRSHWSFYKFVCQLGRQILMEIIRTKKIQHWVHTFWPNSHWGKTSKIRFQVRENIAEFSEGVKKIKCFQLHGPFLDLGSCSNKWIIALQFLLIPNSYFWLEIAPPTFEITFFCERIQTVLFDINYCTTDTHC